jgi:hypothetical protein
MHERLRFIKRGEQAVLLVDFSHCTQQQVLGLVNEAQQQIARHPHNSLLTLADFTDAQINKQVAMRIKEVLVLDRPFVKRSAWVGTASLPKVFYENFKSFSQRDFPVFETREQALEWLTKD